MTRNQIAFQQHLETQRSNQAREQETHRHNRVGEVLDTIDIGRKVVNDLVGFTGVGSSPDSKMFSVLFK